MDTPQKFWNIFQSILRSIGPAALESTENQEELISLFGQILSGLEYAFPIVNIITRFISFACQLFRFISRIASGGSQPLEN